MTDPLALSVLSLIIALTSVCITIWRTRRSYNDSDVEELADQVARLARRARADTMRAVRAAAGGPPASGEADASPPPQLRTSPAPPVDKRELKQQLRRRLLGVH